MTKTISKKKSVEQMERLIERPNGFYWTDETSGKEYGPFPTLLAATQDIQDMGVSDFGEGVPLAEAEAEIGIADWIDPETGEPAEESTPRLADQ